ncbi:MAG TPA: hypothetical protein VH196_00425, partial [Terriglobales bacterium]|nr:hypothetical protein [Terriglobales bacterium]
PSAAGCVSKSSRYPFSFIHIWAVVVCLALLSASVQAKDARTAIVLFDGPTGPAYVQISGLTLNNKNDVRVCDGVSKFDKRTYDTFPKMQLAGASALERDGDGVLKLTANSRQVCIVPNSIRFDHNAEFTPAEAAEQATLQGVVISSSIQGVGIQGTGIPAFKPGVQLIFLPAPDAEMAEYFLAQRAHSVEQWQTFIAHYGSSPRVADAKAFMAAIYEQAAEAAFAAYQKSAGAQPANLGYLKQAQQQAELAENAVAGYPASQTLRQQINKELDALLQLDRGKLQIYRKALAEHTTGCAQLIAAKQHSEQVLDINPQYASAVSLHSEIATEERKLVSTLQSAEGLMASRRYDEAVAALGPYRAFAPEVPRVDAIVAAAYSFHFGRAQEFAKTQAWDQAAAEFRKAIDIRSDSKEAAAALKNAELQSSNALNQAAVQRAVTESNDYAAKNQFIEAYETLANLPDAQQSLVADQLIALQKSYVPAAFRKAQKLQEIHLPIRGRADEDAIRQAYELLDRASSLTGDPAMKLKRDLLSDKISAYYVEQAKRYLQKPMASGVGMGWLYLGEAEHYKPNLEPVREAMAQYGPAYQLRSRLSLGLVLRDQTSRRDSVGFADQMRDAIASGLESSGVPVKVVRQTSEAQSSVQPNFVLIGEILEHRVVKNATLETLQSKYRAGTHDVKSEAWLQANQEYEAAQQQLTLAQRELADAQAQHRKKEIVLADSDAVALAQKHVTDKRQKLDTTQETRSENVIEPYNYTKRTVDLTAVVDMDFRITDQSGNPIEAAVPVRKDDHRTVVVLENVKPEDTEGIKKQSTDPDETQFLTDLEIQERDALVKSVREKVLLLPGKILAEARNRAQRGDLDGAAEEYILYLNAVTDQSQPRDEAAAFLRDHFNVNVAVSSSTSTESRLAQYRSQ